MIVMLIMNILFVLALVSVLAPMGIYKLCGDKRGKECMVINIVSFFGLLAVGFIYVMGCAMHGFAAPADALAEAGTSVGDGLKYIGAALSTGISGVGGGIAVASAASAAIGAMSENEKIMGKTLIFVALAEGIALYGLVISIMIIGM